MGSLFHLPIIQGMDALDSICWMQSEGIKLAAASPYGDVTCWEVDGCEAICWVVGNETQGVSDKVMKACDTVVKIPMPGQAESLNVVTAATILMYEVVRQRIAGARDAIG